MNHYCLDSFRRILAHFSDDLGPLLTHSCVTSFCIAITPIPSPFSPPRTSSTRTCSVFLVPPFMASYDTSTKYTHLVRASQTSGLGGTH